MKQLSLSIYETRKQYKITKKNEKLMKKCFAYTYSLGMVSQDVYEKTLKTNYVRK